MTHKGDRDMRKIVMVVLSASLVFGAFGAPAADAAKKKARKASATYDLPAIGAAGIGVCSPGTIGCVDFATASGERKVSVEIVDSAGTPVFASVSQDLNGDNQADVSTDICGKSDGAIPIEPGFGVTVFIWEGPGANPVCPGFASSGTINLTFSK